MGGFGRDGRPGAAEHGDVRAHLCDVRAVCAAEAAEQPEARRTPTKEPKPSGSGDDINELKRQMEEMQKRLDRLGDKGE